MKNPLTLTPNEQRILDAAWEEAINQGHIPADTNVSNEVVLTPVTNRKRTEQPRPYNMDQPTTSSAMETGWLSKRTHPPQQREEKLYTFIYRGPPPHFDIHTRTNCIYVDHTDHYTLCSNAAHRTSSEPSRELSPLETYPVTARFTL